MSAALRRLTWRRWLLSLAVAAALLAWMTLESGLTSRQLPAVDPARVAMHLAMVFCLLPATLLADDAVDRGRAPLTAYTAAVLGGTLAASLLQRPAVGAWLAAGGELPSAPLRAHPVASFLEYLLWAAIVVWVYANRRRAAAAAARLQAAQLARARVQQRLLSSRLQALQARVEPRFLFNTLDLVRQTYQVDAARAAALLDDLIVYLRNALPQMRLAGSTVARELELVGAYLRILQAQPAGTAPRCYMHTAPGLEDEPLPPMLLLPLVDRLLAETVWGGGDIDVRVETDADAGALRVVVADHQPRPHRAGPAPNLPADIDTRLQQLYGGRARLEIDDSLPRGLCYRMTLPRTPPHGPSDGNPR